MKLPDLQRLTHNCLNRMSQSDQPTWSQDKALHRGIVKPFVQMSTAGYSSGVGHMHVRCATGKSLPPVSHLSELLLEGVLMGLGIEIPQIAAVLKVPNQDTSDGIGVGSSDERHRGHAEQRPYNGDHLTDPCDSHEGHGVDGITSQRTDEPLPTLGRKGTSYRSANLCNMRICTVEMSSPSSKGIGNRPLPEASRSECCRMIRALINRDGSSFWAGFTRDPRRTANAASETCSNSVSGGGSAEPVTEGTGVAPVSGAGTHKASTRSNAWLSEPSVSPGASGGTAGGGDGGKDSACSFLRRLGGVMGTSGQETGVTEPHS